MPGCRFGARPEVDDGLLEEGDEDGLGVREVGHQVDLDTELALVVMMGLRAEIED